MQTKRANTIELKSVRAFFIVCLLMLVCASGAFAGERETPLKSGLPVSSDGTQKSLTGTPNSLSLASAPAAQQQTLTKAQVKAKRLAAPAAEILPAKSAAATAADAKARSYFSGFVTAPMTPVHPKSDNSRVTATVNADFDQDGNMDVVAFNANGILMFMKGDGKGNFTQANVQNIDYEYFTKAVAVDLNGDGYPDIVAYEDNNMSYMDNENMVYVFINQKNGTFADPVTIKPGKVGYSVNGIQSLIDDFAVYDVNGDGHPDIVLVASYGNYSKSTTAVVVEVLFNNGDGTFTQSSAVESDATLAGYMYLIDLGTVSIRKFSGQMYLNFATYIEDYPQVYSYPISAAGAVNFSAGSITNFPSDSDGYDITGVLKYADVNNDGIDDMLFNSSWEGDKGTIYVALGKSDGTFGAPTVAIDSTWGAATSVIGVYDFNGDGNPDLLIPGDDAMLVAYGNGDGTFQTPQNMYQPAFSFDMTGWGDIPVISPMIYDWDGDGKLDVLVPDSYLRQLVLMRGRGDGTFIAPPALISHQQLRSDDEMREMDTWGVDVADVNGDGYPDILLGDVLGINDKKGNFIYTTISPSETMYLYDAPGDFNRDGKDDFVSASSDSSYYSHLWLNISKGDGTFTSSEIPLPYSDILIWDGYAAMNHIIAKDLNGDGYPDLVMCIHSSSLGYGFFTLINDQKGGFTATPFVSFGTAEQTAYPFGFTVADVNNDGYPEVIIDYGSYYYTNSTLAIYNNPGTGNFSTVTPTVVSNFSYPVGKIIAKDLNGDGYPDLVLGVQYEYMYWNYYPGQDKISGVYLALNDGKGNFPTPTALTTAFAPRDIAVEDFNGDGIYDIAVSNANAYEAWLFDDYYSHLLDSEDSNIGVNIYRGNGDGTFAAPVQFGGIEGDLNYLLPINLRNDGSISLIVGTSYGSVLLENKGGTSVTVSATPTTANVGDTVNVTAVVGARVSGMSTPTGSVTFYDNSTEVGTATLDSTGAATYSTSNLAAGTHSFTAAYAGDDTYPANSVSNAFSETVASVTPAFTLATSSPVLSVTSGSTASATLSFTSNAGFNGTIALSCSGAPSNASCAFSSPTVTLAANSTATSTLTITTSTQTARNNAPFQLGGGAATALGLLLMPIFIRKRRRFLSLMLLAVLAVGGFVTGCGSSAKSTTTPAGTYNITVTATPSVSSASAKVATFVVTVK